MRQLPALFSTEMVKALLDNRKTMTRRTKGLEKINALVKKGFDFRYDSIEDGPDKEGYVYFERLTFQPNEKPTEEYRRIRPQYLVGDHIYVKEEYYANGYWTTDGITKTGKPKLRFHDATIEELGEKYQYHDNVPSILESDRSKLHVFGWWKRNSLFMPKKAARIWLECTGVRCERLQDITEADSIAEGIKSEYCDDNEDMLSACGKMYYKFYPCKDLRDNTYIDRAVTSFYSLWSMINGSGSWGLNPWIFVYSFKKLDQSPQSLTLPDKKP